MSDMDKKMILLDDPGDQQPERDPLRPVAGTVIEGETLALFDDAGRFLVAFPARYQDDYEVNPTDRLYRCRVTIDGEGG